MLSGGRPQLAPVPCAAGMLGAHLICWCAAHPALHLLRTRSVSARMTARGQKHEKRSHCWSSRICEAPAERLDQAPSGQMLVCCGGSPGMCECAWSYVEPRWQHMASCRSSAPGQLSCGSGHWVSLSRCRGSCTNSIRSMSDGPSVQDIVHSLLQAVLPCLLSHADWRFGPCSRRV